VYEEGGGGQGVNLGHKIAVDYVMC
jgi:hypothetical protein